MQEENIISPKEFISSYRSELLGMMSMVWFIKLTTLDNQQTMIIILFLIDNKSALNQVFFTKSISSVHNFYQSDFDIIVTVTQLLEEALVTIKAIYSHSCQDKSRT